MDIGCARRGVEDKIVEIAPIGVGDKLFQRRRSHSATPKGCRFGVYEETDRQQFDAVFLDGDNELAAFFLHSVRTLALDA